MQNVNNAMKIISLGWGIQSFTLAAMVALGELENVAAAVHIDAGYEHQSTYEFAARWSNWLEKRGVHVVVIPIQATIIRRSHACTWVDIPAFTTNGQLRRQCTKTWKIAPIHRWLQDNRNGKPVEQWLGISIDELHRMRHSEVAYISNRYPLVELRMTRHDCVSWLLRNGLEVPPRSACVFCPYQSRSEWLRMKNEATQTDWQKAILVDEAIRNIRPPELYVHRDRVPLVAIKSPRDDGQLELGLEFCEEGYCGV